ncbi:HlyD family type I secretion periplasmic adaptor subunit [Niveispirillum fermenti]
MWLIILAAAGAIAWAFLSEVEMVAVAEGRIIPTARLQAVEAAEAGIVRAILVTEGQRVARGQPLVRLDATLSDADEAAARADLSAALLQRARAVALLAHSLGGEARFHPPPGAAPDAAAAEEQAVTARIAEHLSRRAGLAQRRAGAAHAVAEAELEKLEQLLPLIEAQHAAQAELAAKGLSPALRVLQLQERVVAVRQDKAVQQARARETMAQAAMLDREMAQTDAEFRARAAAEQAEAEAVIATRSELVKKAEQRTTLQVLTAPTDGVINEISVTSTGEVLEVGARVATLVPADSALVVEALVLNKDAGHVRQGMEVAVKIESFPFTRHGILHGTVEHLSADSVLDQARGLVFPARIRLTAGGVTDRGEHLHLSPGLTATAEIVTGYRTVADYVLSPIARAANEAGRER